MGEEGIGNLLPPNSNYMKVNKIRLLLIDLSSLDTASTARVAKENPNADFAEVEIKNGEDSVKMTMLEFGERVGLIK